MRLEKFKEIFMGLPRAHGSYVINGERADGKKFEKPSHGEAKSQFVFLLKVVFLPKVALFLIDVLAAKIIFPRHLR